MPVTTIEGHELSVDQEGFLTEYSEWDPDIARVLAAQIGIELTQDHWEAIHFMRQDYADLGETPTIRRVSVAKNIPIKHLFELFPGKPAKKMAYIAGLPKPRGCV